MNTSSEWAIEGGRGSPRQHLGGLRPLGGLRVRLSTTQAAYGRRLGPIP